MKTASSDFDFLISRIKEYIPLDEAETETVARLFAKEVYGKKELILKEGDICKKLYFIARGILRFSLLIDGEDRTFVFRTEGAFCSDLESFLKRQPSKHIVSAVEPTTIFSISHNNLQEFYNELRYGDRFGRLVIEETFVKAVNHLTTFYSESPEKRYLRFISQHREMLQRFPQYQIASYIGVSPQALCRIKKKMLRSNL